MTLRIPLSDESEARLRALAEAAGQDLSSLVAEAIEEKLTLLVGDAADCARRPRTSEQWVAELRSWAASHPRRDCVADDGRESIYDGRGE